MGKVTNTKMPNLRRKRASNQKVQENQPILKCDQMFFLMTLVHRALIHTDPPFFYMFIGAHSQADMGEESSQDIGHTSTMCSLTKTKSYYSHSCHSMAGTMTLQYNTRPGLNYLFRKNRELYLLSNLISDVY